MRDGDYDGTDYGNPFPATALSEGHDDRDSLAYRGGEPIEGCFVCGSPDDCYCPDPEELEDSPSLQDSNPEAWGAAHNVNPWGMEGGY